MHQIKNLTFLLFFSAHFQCTFPAADGAAPQQKSKMAKRSVWAPWVESLPKEIETNIFNMVTPLDDILQLYNVVASFNPTGSNFYQVPVSMNAQGTIAIAGHKENAYILIKNDQGFWAIKAVIPHENFVSFTDINATGDHAVTLTNRDTLKTIKLGLQGNLLETSCIANHDPQKFPNYYHLTRNSSGVVLKRNLSHDHLIILEQRELGTWSIDSTHDHYHPIQGTALNAMGTVAMSWSLSANKGDDKIQISKRKSLGNWSKSEIIVPEDILSLALNAQGTAAICGHRSNKGWIYTAKIFVEDEIGNWRNVANILHDEYIVAVGLNASGTRAITGTGIPHNQVLPGATRIMESNAEGIWSTVSVINHKRTVTGVALNASGSHAIFGLINGDFKILERLEKTELEALTEDQHLFLLQLHEARQEQPEGYVIFDDQKDTEQLELFKTFTPGIRRCLKEKYKLTTQTIRDQALATRKHMPPLQLPSSSNALLLPDCSLSLNQLKGPPQGHATLLQASKDKPRNLKPD